MCTHFRLTRIYQMTHNLLTTCPQLYQTKIFGDAVFEN